MTWAIVALGDVALTVRNGIFTRRPNDDSLGSPILRISSVRDGRVNLNDRRFVEGLDSERIERFRIRPGDLLLTRYNGSRSLVGISGIVPEHDGDVVHPDKLIRVALDTSRVDPRFVNYQLQAPQARAHLEPRIRTTAGQAGIAGADVRSIPVVVPPLDEQRRIVDLLEDHLSRLDAAESLVATSLRRLLTLRRSLLAELHHGPLARLGDLAIDSGYGTSEKCVPDGPGPAVVRIPNLVEGQIDLADEKRIASATADVERYRLVPGDLLIVRTNGSVDLIGRSAVVQNGVDAAFASYLIRYQLRGGQVIPQWVQAMLDAPEVRVRIESLAASSAGQHNLSLAKLDPLEIPLPSLEEQAAGLARLETLDEQIARLRFELAAAHARAAKLRRSMLSAAFSGRLTGSEDVSVLPAMIDA